jgi:hypothetical protein
LYAIPSPRSSFAFALLLADLGITGLLLRELLGVISWGVQSSPLLRFGEAEILELLEAAIA